MSRVQKFGSRRDGRPPSKAGSAGGSDGLDAAGGEYGSRLPSRRVIHPSNKQQMTKWFYRILIVLFLLLLIGLLLWGRKYGDF